MWGDVQFVDPSHILIPMKVPKLRLPQGEFGDLFSFPGHRVCPVAALTTLWDSVPQQSSSSPVFKFGNGSNLTKGGGVNCILPQLLQSHLGAEASNISGHSFRAAIPAVLVCHPDAASSSHIMGWWRWKSEAYQSYVHQAEDRPEEGSIPKNI